MRPDSPNDSLHASVIMGVRPSSGVTIDDIQQLLREVSCSLVEGHGILKGSEVLKILPVSALRIHWPSEKPSRSRSADLPPSRQILCIYCRSRQISNANNPVNSLRWQQIKSLPSQDTLPVLSFKGYLLWVASRARWQLGGGSLPGEIRMLLRCLFSALRLRSCHLLSFFPTKAALSYLMLKFFRRALNKET